MGVGIQNLTGSLQAMVARGYPDIGQTYYLVDSNYRTQAQGWSRADHTGPLDLWAERNRGYVFRAGDFTSDSVCVQAAIDAMVDFRGDTLYFTPGNYSLATALSQNVPDARWVGSPVAAPQACRTTITAAVAAAVGITAAADRMEVAFLKFIPLTAATIFSAAAGADNLHSHDFFYDADGIAANVATIFLTAAGNTNNNCKVERFYMRTDAAQGPLLSFGATFEGLVVRDYEHIHNAGVLATAILTTAGACTGVLIADGHGFVGGGGTVTNLVNWNESGADTSCLHIRNVRNAIGYCAANALVALTGSEAAEVGLAGCYLDVVSGGAGGLGTTFTA